jgi:hypothetical protein
VLKRGLPPQSSFEFVSSLAARLATGLFRRERDQPGDGFAAARDDHLVFAAAFDRFDEPGEVCLGFKHVDHAHRGTPLANSGQGALVAALQQTCPPKKSLKWFSNDFRPGSGSAWKRL